MRQKVSIKRFVLSCVLCTAVCVPWTHAQSPFEIEEIVVLSDDFGRSYTKVAELNHEQIAALPVTNVAEVLAYLPSIDVRSRGASNAQNDISLRGGTFDQVVVLLNGVPLADAQTGHYAMNIPVSIALIERIEVLQGAEADRTGALTGAINIVTKRDVEQDEYTLQMNAGTNGEANPVFAGSWHRGATNVHCSAEYARSDGYYAPTNDTKEQEALQHTDYQLANLYVRTNWRGLIDAQAGAQYKDAGLGTGYGYASTDQFDATRTMFAGIRASIPLGQWCLHTTVAYRGQYDRYEWHRGTVSNRHWTHNTQATVEATYHSNKIGTTSLGAEFRDEFIRSTNMGEHNRWQVTLRAKQQFHWQALPALDASISAAGHYNSWCGWYGSGAAHIGYHFPKRGMVYVSANRSLRMPTWTDMYYKAGVQRGSSDLRAEKAWQVTAGAQYEWKWEQAGSLRIRGDVYYRWGENIIDWTYNETDSLFHATNRNKVNTFGVEADVQYHYNEWLREVAVSYAYTNLSLDVVTAKSNYLDYLRHKVTLHIDHGIYVWSKGRVGANWSLRWQDRMGTYVDIHGTAGNVFEPVLLLDGSIYIELAHVRVSAECTNMTNRHYYDYGAVLMPGAQGRIGLTARF